MNSIKYTTLYAFHAFYKILLILRINATKLVATPTESPEENGYTSFFRFSKPINQDRTLSVSSIDGLAINNRSKKKELTCFVVLFYPISF